MNRSGLLVSGLVLVIAGCDVTVKVNSEKVDPEKVDRAKIDSLLNDLQVKTGVEGTDERCPTELRMGNAYTCQVRTVVGDQVVDLTLDRDGTAHVKWRRPLLGGSALAARVETLPDGSRHAFDCTGKVLLVDDPTSVVVCPEVRRETAHIVIRGKGVDVFDYRYYDDVAGNVEKMAGGNVERIDCPDAETIRGLAPFECKVWRAGRLLTVELTHAPEGWDFKTTDRGPVSALD